jgi:hypothetical protein
MTPRLVTEARRWSAQIFAMWAICCTSAYVIVRTGVIWTPYSIACISDGCGIVGTDLVGHGAAAVFILLGLSASLTMRQEVVSLCRLLPRSAALSAIVGGAFGVWHVLAGANVSWSLAAAALTFTLVCLPPIYRSVAVDFTTQRHREDIAGRLRGRLLRAPLRGLYAVLAWPLMVLARVRRVVAEGRGFKCPACTYFSENPTITLTSRRGPVDIVGTWPTMVAPLFAFPMAHDLAAMKRAWVVPTSQSLVTLEAESEYRRKPPPDACRMLCGSASVRRRQVLVLSFAENAEALPLFSTIVARLGALAPDLSQQTEERVICVAGGTGHRLEVTWLWIRDPTARVWLWAYDAIILPPAGPAETAAAECLLQNFPPQDAQWPEGATPAHAFQRSLWARIFTAPAPDSYQRAVREPPMIVRSIDQVERLAERLIQ